MSRSRYDGISAGNQLTDLFVDQGTDVFDGIDTVLRTFGRNLIGDIVYRHRLLRAHGGHEIFFDIFGHRVLDEIIQPYIIRFYVCHIVTNLSVYILPGRPRTVFLRSFHFSVAALVIFVLPSFDVGS